jgi:hypothetical protein
MSDHETKVQIINPPNKLKAQIDDGRPTKGFDPNLLAKAEKAVEDLKPQMEIHVKAEVVRLNEFMGKVVATQAQDRKILEDMFRVSFELKGQGTSAGYNLVTRFGDSLCRYIENLKQPGAKEIAIMKAHVDSITAITGRGIKGDSNPIGMAIVAELEKVVGRPT